MTTTIYILQLNNDKYYVGKTNKQLNDRYQEHLDGIGSFWTKKYKPLSIIKQIENSSPFDEDRYVKEYMSIYGIENVRGGSYNQEELNSETIKFLRNELRTSNNECYKCGSTSHFVNECDYISINDYIELFITSLNSIECLDREIDYLKNKYRNIKAIYDLYNSKKELLQYVLKCDYNNINKYSYEIKTYYDKFCDKNTYIDVLIIQYYECIFEYNEFYNRCDNSFNFNRGYLTKDINDKLNNMECEKFNKNLDTINIDIIIRQLGAIMKIKYDLIKKN